MDEWDVEHSGCGAASRICSGKRRTGVSSVPCVKAGRLAARAGGAGRSLALQRSSLPSSVRSEREVVSPETTLPNR